jgi:general stress protein 26
VPKTIKEIRQEVWNQFTTMQCVYLATAEGTQPRVRPVTLLDIEKKFWIATSPRSAKARQIFRNPNVEFCLSLKEECGEGYVRVSGVADAEKDDAVRAHIGSQIPFLTQHWSGVDDPNFLLFRITRVEVEYMRPGDMEAYTFII